MRADDKLTALAFDLYERYSLLGALGEFFGLSDSSTKVLDVGGHTPVFWEGFPSLIASFLPGPLSVVGDVQVGPGLRNYVRASGTVLPFADGCFDLVCSLDTLEHLPAGERIPFLRELLRVTRDGLYVAFPFASASNIWAERILTDVLTVYLRSPLPQLQEHKEHGLPDRHAVSSWFDSTSYPFICLEHGNIDVWLSMMLTYHTLRVHCGEDCVHELNRRFNLAHADSDWRAPGYRTVFVLSKKRSAAELRALRDSLCPQPSGLVGTEGVLAFCQTFLSITHGGRALLDKDRHIRNIEAMLADAQRGQAKAAELAGALAELERLASSEPGFVPELTPRAWTGKRLQRLISDLVARCEKQTQLQQSLGEREVELLSLHTQISETEERCASLLRTICLREHELSEARNAGIEKDIETTKLKRLVEELRERAETLQQQLLVEQDEMDKRAERISELSRALDTLSVNVTAADEALQAKLEVITRENRSLREQVHRLAREAATNRQKILDLYQSRIWRSLCSLGRPLLQAGELLRRFPQRTQEEMRLVCDAPEPDQAAGGVFEIRGWALAQSGVASVQVQVDDQPAAVATYGVSRPDVKREQFGWRNSASSGFVFPWDTRTLSAGRHHVKIRAFSRLGRWKETECDVIVQGQTPAGPESASAEPAEAVQNTAVDNEIKLTVDSPEDGETIHGMARVHGWALATSGIFGVNVYVDDQPAAPATYGLPRPDVHSHFPQFRNAGASGFLFQWHTAELSEGRHQLKIEAVSNEGGRSHVERDIELDHRTLYDLWIERNEPTELEKRAMQGALRTLSLRPTISIVTPVYKTPPDLLSKCVSSVIAQIYPNWELCLVDDGSDDEHLTRQLEDFSQQDERIHVKALTANRGIAEATNEALKMCTGDYVGFLDHDDELADFALFEIARLLSTSSDLDVVYSDEDKLDGNGKRYDWFFKPDWSPDLLLSRNYVCHFLVCRRPLLESVRGLRQGFDGSQDYDLILRLSEATTKIKRIPQVLYHWRAVEGSTALAPKAKPKASEAGRRALQEHLHRIAVRATVEETGSCRYRVRYFVDENPQIAIIMPTGGNLELLQGVIEDVLGRTDHKNTELVIVDNSRGDGVRRLLSKFKSARAPIRWLDFRNQPFNYSVLNNAGVRTTNAPYVLFLNDDIRVIHPDWLSAMLEHAQREEVGAVGAKLLYPNDTLQHAGVALGIYDNSGHAFKFIPDAQHAYFDFPDLVRNCLAVTAACMLLRRELFWEVGGFDEQNLSVAFQDVDLCLKLNEKGYRNVYTPFAKLYHLESVTKSEKIPNPLEDGYMKARWSKYISDDPYYNPNLTRQAEDYSLRLE